HTRSYGDWSSDVCSSDLETVRILVGRAEVITPELEKAALAVVDGTPLPMRPEDVEKVRSRLGRFGEPTLQGLWAALPDAASKSRSEERRVGKEGRGWWAV